MGVDRAKGSWGDLVAVVFALAFAVWVTVAAGWVYGLPAWALVILSVVVLRTRRPLRADSGRSADTSAPSGVPAQAGSAVPPVTGTEFVHVHREDWPWRDRFRSYKIVLDGEVVGKVRPGAEEVYPVEPGPHSLAVRVDFTGSSIKYFNVLPGHTVRFTCCPVGSYSIRDLLRKSSTVSLVQDER